MRLAYLTPQYPKVSHTFIRRELRELERRGHRIMRLAIRRADSAIVDPEDFEELSRTLHCVSQPWFELLKAQACTVLSRPRRCVRALRAAVRMGWRSERGVLRHLAYLAEAAFLLRRIEREKVEHIHVHFGTNATAVARLIHCLGGPSYSFTLHGPDEFDAPRSWGLADKQADASFVVAITDYCSAQLRRWSRPEHWPKIKVVRCGVNAAFLNRASAVDPRSRTFVCVGRLCPQKGQLLLIEALSRLRGRGLQARVVLAGDGEMRSAIEKRVGELNLGDWVDITGWVSEQQVRECLMASRALVLPSFAEGLPVVIMEAMALGRPVISTYVAGIPELVEPGKSGWLVPAGNADRLADAMAAALTATADELTRMGQIGAERVRRFHDVSTETSRLESLFLAACASR
jgi:glycosyltransferase involved in cell wall biosynthesis